ncbi:hypothetical protein NQZ79_g8713 [Umbelopsis isabellina]|nr:hypothetical protein NQZ79_g8713 [Umbelopsis isabellina]
MSTHSTDKNDITHHESITMPDERVHATNTPSHATAAAGHLAMAGEFDPAPLGLGAFACTALVLGLVNTGQADLFPSVAVGLCLGYGAVAQLLAGLFEARRGNTFAATTFCSYSCFYFSYGIMLMPTSGFAASAEAAGAAAASTASGAFQLPWAAISFLFFLATLKQPIIMRVFLGLIFLTFFLGTLGGFLLNPTITKASGWVSILLSMTAYYGTAALLYTKENSYFTLPIGAPSGVVKHE